MLAVVAHPDDEVLGCGGTLAKHAEAGDQVRCLGLSARATELAREHGRAFHTELGCRSGRWVDLPDQGFETVPFATVIAHIERDLEFPDIVYTHNPADLNLDHQITAKAVLTAFRPCASRATILAFETISSTEWSPEPFAPNYWVELTKAQVDRKCAALDCYPTEVREWPHPRNAQGIHTWAKYRGAQAGVQYAEAFRLIRCVD